MLKLKTAPSIGIFCLTITLFGIVVATGVEYVFYPEAYAASVAGKKAVIVVTIAVPVSFVLALIIRRNTLLAEELLHLVNRDRLTDVATRDFFFARLEMDADSYGVSLMIDIDHFKVVNDSHGHLVGDRVIAQVAQTLSAQLREEDIVCRFGGEEFLVFLRKATPDEGWAVAERIRKAVQDTVIRGNGGRIGVTVSVGGALKHQLEEIEEAIKRADVCLYEAKRNGRNRTVVAWPMAAPSAGPDGAAPPFVPRSSDATDRRAS
ncbi:GGDEF domain-containing protein [Thalassorhabdomicrobium marinisediminis]|uniref:GGDEF domain-containing protein n=1 Tax=Thalassorhabdomicrobium marinisediminis TaxID=2170577 RepID=UPI00249216C4|nr:GGDEF domain-containing protein [Thalassorhabdomicrobium marinisediminis]